MKLINHRSNKGFTLIELLVAITIFAIIASIAYRTIASLVTTQQVVTASQQKWGGIAKAVSRISTSWNRAIPLAIRDQNGLLQPAVLGKNKLDNNYDAQLELTLSGSIGDAEYGTTPPKRIGFRFLNGQLYLVSWPVLNRVQSTTPRVDLLLDNVAEFTVNFYYPDKQWRDTWPLDNTNFTNLPPGIKIYIKMKSGEEIVRQWAQ